MSARATIEEHSRRNEKIQAIKLYREVTGQGLLDSKLAVEHFIAHGRWSPESTAALAGAGPPAAPPMPTAPPLPAVLQGIAGHVAAKQMIAAIKELRRVSDLGLKEAKEAVEGFAQRGVWPESVLARLGAAAPATTTSATATSSSSFAAVEAFARAGRKIDAIKELRTLTGLGLKEAKDAVESFLASGGWGHGMSVSRPMAASTPTSAPAQTPARAATATPSPATIPAARTDAAAPRDPEAQAAVAVVRAHLRVGRVDQLHEIEKDFARGYLAIVGTRALFLVKRFGEWQVEDEYARDEGVRAEVRASLSRVELRLRKSFVYDSITGLDEATAQAIAALLDGG